LDTQSSFAQLSIENFSNFENVVERILILGRWHQDNAHLLEQSATSLREVGGK
jgi:hypothetical protein